MPDMPKSPLPFWERPLNLTVHNAPAPEQALAAAPGLRRGRWQLLLVVLVCLAPVLASYYAYYVARPEGRRNFGELIEPQRALPELPAVNLSGQVSRLADLRGQWLLLSVSSSACQQRCQDNLYWQRQLRESLGQDKERLDWVWLITDDAPLDAALLPALKTATVLRVSSAGVLAWLSPAPGHELDEHLYLVDPLGHWMMRFGANLDTAGSAHARRDLERLLRASASWDAPGRPATQP